MAAFGVILIVVAVALGAAAFWVATSAGASATTVEMFNNQLSLTPLTMFLLGVAATLLLLLGFWMMTSAGKRRVRRSHERRALEKQQREQEKELAQTRARLSTTSAHETRVQTERVERPGRSGVEHSATTERIVPADGVTGAGPRPDGTYEDGSRPTQP